MNHQSYQYVMEMGCFFKSKHLFFFERFYQWAAVTLNYVLVDEF